MEMPEKVPEIPLELQVRILRVQRDVGMLVSQLRDAQEMVNKLMALAANDCPKGMQLDPMALKFVMASSAQAAQSR